MEEVQENVVKRGKEVVRVSLERQPASERRVLQRLLEIVEIVGQQFV